MNARTLGLALAGLLVLPAGAAAHGPPVVSGGPVGVTTDTRAEFKVAYNEPVLNQEFECKLDSEDWKDCGEIPFEGGEVTVVYEKLADGPHTFQARRAQGDDLPIPDPSVDDEPTKAREWTVDTIAPETTITVAPVSGAQTTVTVEFTSSEPGGSFECSLDGAAFAACASPLALSGLAVGEHRLAVRATDAVGNAESTPAEIAWTVSAPPPAATPAAPAAGPPAAVAPSAPMPLITVGKPVKRPRARRGCAIKRTAKQRAACRRDAARKKRRSGR